MLPDKKRFTLQEVLTIFELDPSCADMIKKQYPSITHAQKAIDEFKDIIKKAYRKVAFKYHPDHGGSEDDFKVINNLYENMMKLKVMKQPPVQYVRMYYHYSGTASSSTTTNTSWV